MRVRIISALALMTIIAWHFISVARGGEVYILSSVAITGLIGQLIIYLVPGLGFIGLLVALGCVASKLRIMEASNYSYLNVMSDFYILPVLLFLYSLILYLPRARSEVSLPKEK